jgi:DNA-binding response OmpR family regulator
MKKILFVEDEFNLQKSVGEFLKEKGYEVVHALDGEMGLKLANEDKPDLMLLDIILPKMNGFEVLKKLKREEKTKDIPVIVLTNLENPQDIEKSLTLGAKTYLVKSDYELEDISEKIEQTIGS